MFLLQQIELFIISQLLDFKELEKILFQLLEKNFMLTIV